MRLAGLCLALVCALVIFAPPVYPQSMLEYGASAAGGSTMGVAGKGVSNGIDSIFRKLDKQTGTAASTAKRPGTLQAPARAETSGAPEPGPVVSASRAQIANAATAPSLATLSREVSGGAVWNGASSQPEEPELTRADLAAVESGEGRDELVSRLGAPSARVIIPDGGHLEEVYLYHSSQTHLGKVTLVDGSVSSVSVQ